MLKLIMLSRCLLSRTPFAFRTKRCSNLYSSFGSFASDSTVPVKDDNSLVSTHRFSVAPMMQFTDEYQRFFMRLISSKAVLYTEMVTATALVNNKNPRNLLGIKFDARPPVVLQLGGSSPSLMREAAVIAKRNGYLDINLNIGCPSPRVAGSGCFGAALMLEPVLVGEMASAISEVTGRPTSVKCRLGVNDEQSYEAIHSFVDTVRSVGGVDHFVVHARNAVLNKKFSPEDNRKIPPLKYPYVYRLCLDFPDLMITLNGGVSSYEDAQEHLNRGTHGVMVGRAVINNPYYWRNVDSRLFGCVDTGKPNRVSYYCVTSIK